VGGHSSFCVAGNAKILSPVIWRWWFQTQCCKLCQSSPPLFPLIYGPGFGGYPFSLMYPEGKTQWLYTNIPYPWHSNMSLPYPNLWLQKKVIPLLLNDTRLNFGFIYQWVFSMGSLVRVVSSAAVFTTSVLINPLALTYILAIHIGNMHGWGFVKQTTLIYLDSHATYHHNTCSHLHMHKETHQSLEYTIENISRCLILEKIFYLFLPHKTCCKYANSKTK
jgi:hypothetical protein